jgi:EAL domain-containing protein (putative c-di-GMP-specific phosphodiesterase class I)
MYIAKQQGKDRLITFSAKVHDATLERLQLRTDLTVALDHGEFSIDYQPVIELATGEIRGVEALVRWLHPRRGLLGPSEFIPLAEENGEILAIGRWVLRQACVQARAWSRFAPGGLSMAVNLSGRQIDDPHLVADVSAALAASGLPAHRLTLEITESVLMADVDTTTATLHALKALGVRLAIDDFGTGYSSLSYLRRFPVDILKIDRSFVATLHTGDTDIALVRSILSLGQTLELETIAEGIEEVAQLDQLRKLGASLGQGYLFARPLDPDALTELLEDRMQEPFWRPLRAVSRPAASPTARRTTGKTDRLAGVKR